MTRADWRADVLKFWFSLGAERWFKTDPALDHQISQRFLKIWADERQLPVDAFLTDPLTALAGVILFDQLPRNMSRDNAEQFATDDLALGIARAATDAGFDDQLDLDERMFLYLPFEHSENLADQNRSILMFTKLGNKHYLDFAKRHYDIIERFGRFPHRNHILGRQPRAAEIAAGNVVPW